MSKQVRQFICHHWSNEELEADAKPRGKIQWCHLKVRSRVVLCGSALKTKQIFQYHWQHWLLLSMALSTRRKDLMQSSNKMLRQELVAMAENDLSVREKLVADGSLGNHGYHPRMEAVHKSNTARLATIIDHYGWPGKSLVGKDGAWAA